MKQAYRFTQLASIGFACLALVGLAWTPITAQAQTQAQAQGGQFLQVGPWDVHYSAFPSRFLQPEIAQAYQLTRSKAQGVISITVLDSQTQEAQRASVQGYALNELGQRQELQFKRIREQHAFYFVASIRHAREEHFRFFIQVSHGNNEESIEFKQSFYQ